MNELQQAELKWFQNAIVFLTVVGLWSAFMYGLGYWVGSYQ